MRVVRFNVPLDDFIVIDDLIDSDEDDGIEEDSDLTGAFIDSLVNAGFEDEMPGEQWGLIGVLVLLMMYVALVLVGFRIASRAPDLFGELLALGFTSLIALQALLHMAVGLSLLPTTGLALPLVSYGRSNLIVTLASLGILISVARMAPGIKAARA